MCRLDYAARQNDMHARYWAIKMYILCCFYSDAFLPVIPLWTCNVIKTYLLTLYIAVVFSVFFGIQYEKTDATNEFILFTYAKYIFLFLIKNIGVFLKFFVVTFFFFFKKILSFLFYIFKKMFLIWRPIFKKFGYLLSFFKKNKK